MNGLAGSSGRLKSGEVLHALRAFGQERAR